MAALLVQGASYQIPMAFPVQQRGVRKSSHLADPHPAPRSWISRSDRDGAGLFPCIIALPVLHVRHYAWQCLCSLPNISTSCEKQTKLRWRSIMTGTRLAGFQASEQSKPTETLYPNLMLVIPLPQTVCGLCVEPRFCALGAESGAGASPKLPHLVIALRPSTCTSNNRSKEKVRRAHALCDCSVVI